MTRTLNICITVVLFLCVVLILHYAPGHITDQECWIEWAKYINDHGLINAYGSGTDYLPGYHYILWLFAKIEGNEHNIAKQIVYLRCFTLVFDFVGLWYVCKWTDKKTPYYIILLISVLNIAYLYNTAIWGQVDGIFSALAFISIYYAWKNKMLWSTAALVLAINFKLQGIFILPVWGLLFLDNIIASPGLKKVLYPIFLAILIQIIVIFPFTLGHYHSSDIFKVVTGSVDKYPVLSADALNFWYRAIQNGTQAMPDHEIWLGGLSYKQIGQCLFLLTSFIALLPMMAQVLKRLKKVNNYTVISREMILLTSALVYLLFFYFNTQMHERYSHPAFIFITAYAFVTKDFFIYIVFSFAYLLNLEWVLQYFPMSHGTLIFEPWFISSLFALCIAYLFFRSYSVWKKANKPNPEYGL